MRIQDIYTVGGVAMIFLPLVLSQQPSVNCQQESSFLQAGQWKVFEFPQDYDKEQPPEEENDDKPIRIYVSVFVREISDVIEEKSEIKMFVHLRVYWTETRLRLINSSYFDKGEEALMLDPKTLSKFWLPDVYITNLKTLTTQAFLEKIESIRIFQNKTVRYTIAGEITVVCPMDFVLYPLDVQSCELDFTSYSYGRKIMRFEWRNDPPLILSDLWDHLPHFEVQMKAEPSKNVTTIFQNDEFSVARLHLVLRRKLSYHILQTYLPSGLFVCISWISFIVVPEVVPGRMVLLVTNLLTLVTMYDSVRTQAPPANNIKCIEVWVIVCIVYVFLALAEYAACLYLATYTRHDINRAEPEETTTENPEQSIQPVSIISSANNGNKNTSPLHQVKDADGEAAANNRPVHTLFKRAVVSPKVNDVSMSLQQSMDDLDALLARRRKIRSSEWTTRSPGWTPRQVNVEARELQSSSGWLGKDGVLNLHPNLLASRSVSKRKLPMKLQPLDRISLYIFPSTFFLFILTYWIWYVSLHNSIHVGIPIDDETSATSST